MICKGHLALLVIAGLMSTTFMDISHGAVMEVWMGVTGALWIAVIVIATRRVE